MLPPVAMVPWRRVGEKKMSIVLCLRYPQPPFVCFPWVIILLLQPTGAVVTTATHMHTHTLITGCVIKVACVWDALVFCKCLFMFFLWGLEQEHLKVASQLWIWHFYHSLLNQCLLHVYTEHKIKLWCRTAVTQRVFGCNYGVIIAAVVSARCSWPDLTFKSAWRTKRWTQLIPSLVLLRGRRAQSVRLFFADTQDVSHSQICCCCACVCVCVCSGSSSALRESRCAAASAAMGSEHNEG